MITSKQRFVLAVLLLVAPFAFAQQSGRITGTVFDDARKPLVGASVTVANTTREHLLGRQIRDRRLAE